MNMGAIDRVARGVVALVLLVIGFFLAHGAWQIVLWVIGTLLAATAIIGFCPVYAVFHFSSKRQ